MIPIAFSLEPFVAAFSVFSFRYLPRGHQQQPGPPGFVLVLVPVELKFS
jgi:hypothetical protein